MKPFGRYERTMVSYALFSRPRRRTVGIEDFVTCGAGPLQGELLQVTAFDPRSMKVIVEIRPDQGYALIEHQLLFHILDYLYAIVEVAQTDEVLLRHRR